MDNKVKTIVLKLSDNTMKKMEEYFEDKKREKTPPYAIFQADEADTVVTLYQSGKAMFQGISADIDPFITLSFMALTVIPEIRVTERGVYLFGN